MPRRNEIEKRGLQNQVLEDRLNGLSLREIAKKHDLKLDCVHRHLKKVEGNNQTVAIRQTIRLEITQENALTELSKQMQVYTQNFERAMKDGDEKSAYAWSQNRIALLDKMLRVTGLYSEKHGDEETKLTIEVVGL